MAPLDFLSHVRTESARFADCLRTVDPAAAVTTCPGWSAADLLWHLTEVQAFWATIVADRLETPEAAGAADTPRPTDYGELHELFDRTTARLLDTLATTPPDTPVWTWAPDRTAGFVLRRQAHEALIHRRDAESVLGSFTPFDTALAADGIDEALRIVFASSGEPTEFTPDGSACRVELTDAPDRWVLRLGTDIDSGADSYSVDAESDGRTPTGATVRAGAADLDLWLWNRSEGGLKVEGDRSVFDRFAAIVAAGIE